MSTPSFLVSLMLGGALSRNIRLGPEDREGRELATRLRAWTLEGVLNAVWTHIPNEAAGHSDPKMRRKAQIRYAIAKALGLIPGAPDYVFLGADGAYCIELKAPGGSATPAQKNFRAWCERAGVPYAVCKGADAAEAQLREWKLITEKSGAAE